MSGRRLRWAAGALVLIASVACAGDGALPGFVTQRDSAGVRIVENAAPAIEAAARWSIDSIPRVTIDGGPEPLFRANAALRLEDGRVVVLNSGSSQLRWFDGSGAPVHTAGGPGEGPGELVAATGLARFGRDSLLVWDARLQRFSTFSLEGAFGRAQPIDPALAGSLLAGVPDGGGIVLGSVAFEMPEHGFVTAPLTLYRYRADGTVADTLTTLPWTEVGVFAPEGQTPRVGPRTFGATGSVTVAGEHVFAGGGASPVVNVYAADGSLVRSIRWDAGDRSTGAEDVRRYLEERYASAAPEVRRAIEETPPASNFPAWTHLAVDGDGNLWVAPYRRPGASGPDRWLVFDPDGVLIAAAELPMRTQVLDIGSDVILLHRRDPLGLEKIAAHGLRK